MKDNVSTIIICFIMIYGIVSVLISLINNYKKSKCSHGIWKGNKLKNGRMRCKECQRILEENEKKKKTELYYQKIKEETKRKFEQSIITAIEEKKKAITSDEQMLHSMSPVEFEDMVAELFRRMDYKVTQTPYTNDGGKDAYLEKDGVKYLLECKRYQASASIGRPMIQKLVGAMSGEHIQQGIFVATTRYTKEATDYAKMCNVKLIDIDYLVLLCKKYLYPQEKQSYIITCLTCGEPVSFSMFDDCEKKDCINGHSVKNIFWNTSPNEPLCHHCGSKLIKKNGYYGNYYTCTNPSCGYKISVYEYQVENKTRKPMKKGYKNGIYID